ncbi:MAG: NAD-dependent epimerase/dehydratase family protein [Solirubrobacterales bacterium]
MTSTPRKVAIAGISTGAGTELALRLEREPSIEAIYGLDTTHPEAPLERTELIDVDLRSPTLSRILPGTGVDTVVHCGILWSPEPGKPARALHDLNVIGTLQLLAACEQTPGLERVIARGSAAVYGSSAAAPSFFTEDMARALPLKTQFQRDLGELEAYFENFARRHPDIVCCMLRFQPDLGEGRDSPLGRYLSLPIVPTQLGFDPRLQFLDPGDAAEALLMSTIAPVAGAVNVAPSGSISLSRALRLLRRPGLPVPHPTFEPILRRFGGSGMLGEDAATLLRYGRGLDNRRLLSELDFKPRFDAVGSIRELARRRGAVGIVPPPGAHRLLRQIGGAR